MRGGGRGVISRRGDVGTEVGAKLAGVEIAFLKKDGMALEQCRR